MAFLKNFYTDTEDFSLLNRWNLICLKALTLTGSSVLFSKIKYAQKNNGKLYKQIFSKKKFNYLKDAILSSESFSSGNWPATCIGSLESPRITTDAKLK